MFHTKRFGMFVHWGLYAINAWHEQEQWRYPVDSKTYIKYTERFNPRYFDADSWVSLAQKAGMDYICFTTKHHDGFCMWDTLYTDFKVTNTPYGKDVLASLARACEAKGMGLSLYYSVPDWHHPNYPNFGGDHELSEPKEGDCPNEDLYIDYVKNQITELLTKYGKIQSFFWDIPPLRRDPSVNELVRKLQPGIMINNRGYDDGDFATPERTLPKGSCFTSYTEACNSVGRQSWGYRINEDYHSHKYLISSVDRIMAMGGNYVLNVGPDADGIITEEARDSINAVGKWYNNVKEALYAKPCAEILTEDAPYLTTRSGNTLYIHFPESPEASGFFIQNIKKLPQKAIVLNDHTEIKVSMDMMPTLCMGSDAKRIPVLHIYSIPVNRLESETIVLKLEFDNLDEAIDTSCEFSTESRL